MLDLIGLGLLWGVLFLLNLRGLVPYGWAFSINPVSNLFIMVIFWFSLRLFVYFRGGLNLTYRGWAHLLPTGTPIFLWGVLPLIELISQFLRPITLTLRLRANLIAGHVLVFLRGQLGVVLGGLGYLILLPFEMMVSLVQRVVVYLLLLSYYSEL
jgi:F-type H+-transporting ATPase subunit a